MVVGEWYTFELRDCPLIRRYIAEIIVVVVEKSVVFVVVVVFGLLNILFLLF